jgi:thiamine kinase-like enzyme
MTNDGRPVSRIARLPCWSGRVDPVPLPGGITNRNYLVTDRGRKFVVRLGEDIPIHGVMRFNELAASRAAFEAGVSPEVVYAESGALVLRFVEGRTLCPELVRDPAILSAAVDLVKRCHERIPLTLRGPALMFWVFQVIREYGAELRAQDSPHAALVPQLVEGAEHLEREVGPVSIVFGHNDLLAANFIDDGKRLWLIDWDYAGFNSPLFDLGGLASNNDLDPVEIRFVLTRYFGNVDASLMRRFAAMKCASLLRETMWSMVSELHSTIQFDYAAYTNDYLNRFRRAYDEFVRGMQ